MVGASAIVAQGFRAVAPQKDGAGVADLVGPDLWVLRGNFQVLGRKLIRDAQGFGRIGGLDQTLLVGFELGWQDGRNQRRNGIFSTTSTGPTSISRPLDEVTVAVPVTFLANGANNDMKTTVAAVYVQNQIRPADWLEIVAGLRFDSLKMTIDNRNDGSSFGRTDNLWSPRLGLILKPRDNLSIYSSYGRSYLPQSGDQFNSLAANTETLKPERFDNYEVGAKWEPIEGLLATAAVYQLDRTNTQARNALDQVVLTGAQRSRGLELGLERSAHVRLLRNATFQAKDRCHLRIVDEGVHVGEGAVVIQPFAPFQEKSAPLEKAAIDSRVRPESRQSR